MASVHETANALEVRAYAGRDRVTGSVRNLYRRLPVSAHACEVEAAKAELQALADRFKGSGEPFTLEGMLEFYFGMLEADHSPTYVDGLRSNARCHLYPTLGSRRIDTVRPYEIAQVYRTMCAPESQGGKGLSPNTARKLNSWLHHAFRELRGMGLIQTDPLEGVSAPKPAANEARALDAADLAKLSGYLRQRCMGEEPPDALDAALWVDLNTGLRRGELAGLRCGDVSAIRPELRVARSVGRSVGKGIFAKPPKSAAGKRTLALGESTYTVLLRAVKRARSASLLRDPAVFGNPDGTHRDPRDFSCHFRAVCDQLGIGSYAHLHTLRHTHATYLLARGTPMRTVQQRLGHSSVSITVGTYGHALPGSDQAAADDFDSILESLD